MTMRVGHGRFDVYNKPVSALEIVGEPMAKKFNKDYPPKVVKASDYKLGDDGKKFDNVAEKAIKTVIIPTHTAKDKEIVDVTISGKTHRVPHWMVKYINGLC